MKLLNILARQLRIIADNIDAGNSNLSEDELDELMDQLVKLSQKSEPISKYQAAAYVNVSERTFDTYIKNGRLPKGKKIPGFKELSWTKKELDEAIKKVKH